MGVTSIQKNTTGVGTIKRVFLIEHPEDIDSALSLNNRDREDRTFIALRPAVAWELECRGIQFKNIRSFNAGKERWNKTNENFGILDAIAAEIDNGIKDFLSVKTVRPAVSSYYYLKIALDVITTKILLIETIISKEKPDELVTCYHNPPKNDGFFPFSEEESVFSYLLEMEGWHIPVRIIRQGIQDEQRSRSDQTLKRSFFNETAISFVRRNNKLSNLAFNAAFIYRYFGPAESITGLIRSLMPHPRREVIICGSGYNWDYSLPELFKAGIRPVYHLFGNPTEPDNSIGTHELYEKILNICKTSGKIRHYALISGIDTSPILFEKIASIVCRAYITGEKEYGRSTAIFKRTRVRCVLVSTQASHLERAVTQAARDLGIPVISWQHGGAGYCYHPFMYRAEFFNSDIHLVFGEAVARSYQKTSELLGLEKICPFIAVGSSRLDWLSEKFMCINPQKSPNSGSIVYITEKFQFNLYYNSTTFDSTEICDHFWDVQRQFLDFAGAHPEIPVVFKLHPADSQGEPARSYAIKQAMNNVHFIVQERKIEDLIPDARAVIIDFVATSVLEAAVSVKPVFIFTGMFAMESTPVSLLKKRAFLYDSFPELLEGLERFLLVGSAAFAEENGVDYQNTEFIRSFGTDRHDGGSSRRAAAEIITQVFPEP